MHTQHLKSWVRPDFMAGMSVRGVGVSRKPRSGGLGDGFEGADGFGVVCVPAAAVAFEAEGFAFALGFGGAAADVASGGEEFGVGDQRAVVADVVHQAVGGLFLLRAAPGFIPLRLHQSCRAKSEDGW